MNRYVGMLDMVRTNQPLVHQITNWVTTYECAAITRSTGALPVMAHAIDEVHEMVGIAGSLVLNIGTLTPPLIDSMIRAGKNANENDIPVVLDVVGAGATALRTESAMRIMDEVKVTVLKGNAGEIATMYGAAAEVKGVESISFEGDIEQISRALAKEHDCIIAVTAKTDIVTDGDRLFRVNNGAFMMGNVVGTGCMSSAVIGSFLAATRGSDFVPIEATAAALSAFGIAGENASLTSSGPGSMKLNLLDSLYNLDAEIFDKRWNVEELDS